MKEKEMHLVINGKEYSVVISDFNAYEAVIAVNSKKYAVVIKDLGIEQVSDVTPQEGPEAKEEQAATQSKTQQPAYHRPTSVVQANSVVTPLPGMIQKIFVRVGDTVKVGQPILVLEAMKMENEITSNFAGEVKEIKCREGESVPEGAVLVVLH